LGIVAFFSYPVIKIAHSWHAITIHAFLEEWGGLGDFVAKEKVLVVVEAKHLISGYYRGQSKWHDPCTNNGV